MIENKVVIKIDYDKLKAGRNQPEIVTEWHKTRILMAIILLMMLVGLLIYAFSNNENKKTQSIDNIKQADFASIQSKLTEPVIKPKSVAQVKKTIDQNQIPFIPESETLSQADGNNSHSVIAQVEILDQRISRAALAKNLEKKEPVGVVLIPIVADKSKAISVHFFTEINNMKGKELFHEWSKNDQRVFKRKINISGDRWRASTSKLLSYSARGKWVVKLVDGSSKVLSIVTFTVI